MNDKGVGPMAVPGPGPIKQRRQGPHADFDGETSCSRSGSPVMFREMIIERKKDVVTRIFIDSRPAGRSNER
jgi:hypothetical protein